MAAVAAAAELAHLDVPQPYSCMRAAAILGRGVAIPPGILRRSESAHVDACLNSVGVRAVSRAVQAVHAAAPRDGAAGRHSCPAGGSRPAAARRRDPQPAPAAGVAPGPERPARARLPGRLRQRPRIGRSFNEWQGLWRGTPSGPRGGAVVAGRRIHHLRQCQLARLCAAIGGAASVAAGAAALDHPGSVVSGRAMAAELIADIVAAGKCLCCLNVGELPPLGGP